MTTELISHPASGTSNGQPIARSLRAAIVLAGATGRLAQVRSALQRNLFDLPGTDGRSLLAAWLDRFAVLMDARSAALPVLLAVDQACLPAATGARGTSRLNVEMIRDAVETRGTAGVLRDLTADFAAEDEVLVVQASDLAWTWTRDEGQALLTQPADVVVSADAELRPAGLMRIRCGLLKRVPSIGFVDLKEQFLPRCAGAADVHVVRSRSRRAGSLQSLRSYLELAVGPDADRIASSPATAQVWRADRATVEAGAEVHPSAILFDSVVLAGARVERDAVVVRSLVGPGAIVGSGVEIADQLVIAADGRARSGAVVQW